LLGICNQAGKRVHLHTLQRTCRESINYASYSIH